MITFCDVADHVPLLMCIPWLSQFKVCMLGTLLASLSQQQEFLFGIRSQKQTKSGAPLTKCGGLDRAFRRFLGL